VPANTVMPLAAITSGKAADWMLAPPPVHGSAARSVRK
jgi:hypothetical protein